VQKLNITLPLFLIAIFFTQLFCTNATQNIIEDPAIKKVNFSGKIIGISDGDTYKILYEKKSLTIRLAHIDCPEKRGGQPFGKAAKQKASDICFGKTVNIVHNGFDRNKRIIAEVYLENKDCVNLLMVQMGYAWHYKEYSKNSTYAEAENIARKAQIGLWADANPIPPWVFRKTKAALPIAE
jgi:endonuclease YncB( thermonuclease family)